MSSVVVSYVPPCLGSAAVCMTTYLMARVDCWRCMRGLYLAVYAARRDCVFGGNLGQFGGIWGGICPKALTKAAVMWYNMAMITIRCNGRCVDSGLPYEALALLMRPPVDKDVVYDLYGHVGVITAICEVRVYRAEEVSVYETASFGFSLGVMDWRCTCPEAVYGRSRRTGYRLGVACKHAVLLHLLKGPHQVRQVQTLLRLLYGDITAEVKCHA